ncbi:MAG: hypothetical protein ACE15B_17690 [Bryobacteraceae bacterium]
MKRALLLVSVFALASAAALAQQVISAKSGLIHYTEGRVFVGDQAIESKAGVFPEIKENATLRTQLGRAEVLLTPGVFLRLGENSAVRMISNRLIDTRLELMSGAAVIEADEIAKDTGVTVVLKDAAIQLAKKGLYRFDGNPAALRVIDGEAQVETAAGRIEVRDGRMLAIDGQMAVTRFDKESTDALDRWSRRRGEYVAMANVSAANSIRRSGNSWLSSGWAWNPYFGMYTFIPLRGDFLSPYGYRFWSPAAVISLYRPRIMDANPWASAGGGGMGYPTFSRTSSGYSGAVAAAPSVSAPASHAPTTSAPAAASAPISRGSGSAGGSHK